MSYQHAIECRNCKAIGEVNGMDKDFANSFTRHRLCGACGSREGWDNTIVKWVSTAKLLKPSSWFSGYWQRKDEE